MNFNIPRGVDGDGGEDIGDVIDRINELDTDMDAVDARVSVLEDNSLHLSATYDTANEVIEFVFVTS